MGAHANKRVAMVAGSVAILMLGAAYAAVPLYRLFCQATGYGGTTQRAQRAPDAISDRQISVRLNGNVASGLPWTFSPERNTLDVRFGETMLATFNAVNTSERATKGTATFNVVPEIAGQYFSKIECFCFTEQVLEPGQKAAFPVTFFVDPAMLKDTDAAKVEEITLSYTFFPVAERRTPVVAGSGTPNVDRGTTLGQDKAGG